MPYINIKVTEEAVTSEQKKALIKGATKLVVDVLNKSPKTTFVIIEEVNTDNWGIGFEQVTELRRQASEPPTEKS
ncbi:MAG: 4-oxalocrotonate tautomerase [Glaciecola sp.]|jgi:4-oxalocrotonate tautomerase